MKLRAWAEIWSGSEWKHHGELVFNDAIESLMIPWEDVANAAVENAGADGIYRFQLEKSELVGVWTPLATFGPYGLIDDSIDTMLALVGG